MVKVGILVIDDDASSQGALTSILETEGWRVRIVSEIPHAMNQLASGEWSLVIVNVGLTGATVYYDHPVHAQAEHTLNIDFTDGRPGHRVAVELTAASARELVTAIEAALASAPEALKV